MRVTERLATCMSLEFDLEGKTVQCVCRDGNECLSGFSMYFSGVHVSLWGKLFDNAGRNSHVWIGRYDLGVIGIACEELMS